MTGHIETPSTPDRSSVASVVGTRKTAMPGAVARWENEGGHLSGALAGAGDVTIAAAAARIRDLEAALRHDFSNGLVGTRFNTFEHRSRIIRQLSGELAARLASAQR